METCREHLTARDRYESFHPRRCGRAIKADGLCGLHLAAKERAQAKLKADNDAAERDDALIRRAREAGIAVWKRYGRAHDFVISRDELVKLLDTRR